MTNDDELSVEVFRAGDYGPKGAYDQEALDAMASDYDAARHEAPITLDHAQDGPAEGWVRGLARVGDRLVARLGGVSDRLRALLRSGAYRKRSVELYRALPATGRPYVKTVSFLGAAAPEVKGLADPVFAEVATFDEPGGIEAADALLARLREARRWNPLWRDETLRPVFAELARAGQLAPLEEALLAPFPDAMIGAAPRDDEPVHAFAEGPRLQADCEPRSLDRHRRALALQSNDPNLTYAQALLCLRA